MKIDIFIKEYKETIDKESLLKDVIKSSYIKYTTKIDDCLKIVKYSSEQEGLFKISTPTRYMLFIVTLVNRYTLLEYDQDNIVELFEVLDELDLINKILEYIPEREYESYSTILSMCQADYMENNRSLIGYIDTKFNALKITGDTLLEGLEQFISIDRSGE